MGSSCGHGGPISNAIGYAMHYSRSHDAVIRVYDDAGNERMKILPQRDAMGAVPESGAALAMV
jgi:hypothetical protein